MGRLWIMTAALLLLCACEATKEDDAIRRLVEKSADLAEAKQVGELMRQTGEGFFAMPGRKDAREVKSILFAAFMHYGRFKIHYPRPGVEIDADGRRAAAVVYFVIVRQNLDLPGLKDLYENPRLWLEAAGEKADLYQLKLELEKQKSEWLVMEADLQGFQGRGF